MEVSWKKKIKSVIPELLVSREKKNYVYPGYSCLALGARLNFSHVYASYFVTAITYTGDGSSEKSLTNGYLDEVITK